MRRQEGEPAGGSAGEVLHVLGPCSCELAGDPGGVGLDEPEQRADPAEPVRLAEVRGEVAFDRVVFGYEPEKTIIKDFSAHVLPGQRVRKLDPQQASQMPKLAGTAPPVRQDMIDKVRLVLTTC